VIPSKNLVTDNANHRYWLRRLQTLADPELISTISTVSCVLGGHVNVSLGGSHPKMSPSPVHDTMHISSLF